MPTSEARIRANQANAARSTGPKTVEGKERSRANAYKHGLTGSGTVLPEREAVEVERRYGAFHQELNPSGEVGEALLRLAATMAVRLERCFEHENAALTDRVRRAEREFVPPADVDQAGAARLRDQAGKLALFDHSKEATLSRRYESAAQRMFLRALKEFRVVEQQAKRGQEEAVEEMMGSLLQDAKLDAEFAAIERQSARMPVRNGVETRRPVSAPPSRMPVEVPMTIGRRR